MDATDVGRVPLAPGSREPSPASGLGPSGFDPSRDDTDELLEQLEQAALTYDADLIAGNLFQAAYAAVHAQRQEIERLLRANGEVALEWVRQVERVEDAELALRIWDVGGNSEYWLRHPSPISDSDRNPKGGDSEAAPCAA